MASERIFAMEIGLLKNAGVQDSHFQTSLLPARYVALDVLRGFAAFWVVLSHYLPYWNRYLGSVPTIVPNEWGVYAVKLFFVISGFVIFLTLQRCTSVLDFAVLRVSRLYPTYWATLILAVLISVLVFDHTLWLPSIVVNATMLQDFIGYPRFDNVYWSLSVEAAFYGIVVVLFAFNLHRHRLSFVVIWLVCSVVWFIFVGQASLDYRHWLALFLALDYSPYFAIGIVFFDAIQHGWSATRVAVILFATITEFVIAGVEGFLVAISVTLLFELAICGTLRFLVSRLTLWMGAISYALYLIHRNLGYELLKWFHDQGFGPAMAVAVTTVGALGIATLVTYGVERPALRYIRSWYLASSSG